MSLCLLCSADNQSHSFSAYCACGDEGMSPVLETILERVSRLMRRAVSLVKEVRESIAGRGTSVRRESVLVCLEGASGSGVTGGRES